ncbi:MAG TPA: heavy metal translocating P-type ATPase [Acidimicrobiales bacterium]|nr:heavy metal translocating P-type ATPase [Acidimicrobiales bacterium]
MATSSASARSWARERLALLVLVVALAGLALGAVLHASGAARAGDAAWIAIAGIGVALSLLSMVESLRRGRLGVDVIALLALVGAVAVGEFLAAGIISVMVATGQSLEGWAAGRARRELAALLARAPKTAHCYRDGTLVTVALDEVAVGDRLMVAAGELVPVDGTITSDAATLDESALTGEPLPVERERGEWIRSGIVNAGAPIEMRATAVAADSTFSGIVRLVAEAESSQAPSVRLADRYALVFLAVTLATSALAWAVGGATRAVAVLVVATPCPLILAAPVAFVSGLSRAARRNIIIKGGAVLEQLAKITTLLIDKTGTITMGHPALRDVVCAGDLSADELLTIAASLDQMSPHVIAAAVVRAALDRGITLVLPDEVDEIAGRGIRGVVDGHTVLMGNAGWTGLVGTPTWAKSARRRARLEGSLTVFIAVDGRPSGVLVFDDPLRPDAARTLRSLRRDGIRRVVLVTGDRVDVAETIGAVVGVDEVLAERSPREKLDVVQLESRRAPTIMVGDGINDAPALALADVGVAMGARGATAASEAADVVITVDRFDRLHEALDVARRTRRIAVESMVTGMSLSLVAMGVAAAGYLPAVSGALLQELIDAAVIFNSLRALRASSRERRLTEEDSALTRRFRDEHRMITDVIAEIEAVANSLDSLERGAVMGVVRAAHRQLVDQVLPHEEAEEMVLYPALGRFFGGSDPMGTMSRAHIEIAHRVRRLGHLIDDIGDEAPDDTDLTELRSVLYGLHAILKLHTAQEEEHYLSLAEDESSAGAKVVVSH